MIGVDCFIHGLHAGLVPIEAHHIHPVPRGGDPGAAVIPLCANSHGLVHALLDEIEMTAISSPYATLHEIVRTLPGKPAHRSAGRVRIVAYRGWQAYGLGFIGHRYDRQHRLWDSLGRARQANMPAYGQTARALALSRRQRRDIAAL